MSLKYISGGTGDVVSTDEINEHVKRDDLTAETNLVPLYTKAAVELAEKFIRRRILSSVYELYLDCFPYDRRQGSTRYGTRAGDIDLPLPPVTAITHIKYVNASGVLTTLDSADYQSELEAVPARVAPVYGKAWPETQPSTFKAVQINFTAGWANAAAVPPLLKQAILLQIGNWYANRQTMAFGTVAAKLDQDVKDVLRHYRNEYVN